VCGYIRPGRNQAGKEDLKVKPKAYINCDTSCELQPGDELVLVAPCSSGIELLQQPYEFEPVR
jgi:hypothetical protein